MACLYTDFVGSTNTINIMFKFIDFYSFIPVSGCVGMDHSALPYTGLEHLVLIEIRTHNISGDEHLLHR
jgi:hypothetical protein